MTKAIAKNSVARCQTFTTTFLATFLATSFAVGLFSEIASAAPSSLPVLAKRFSSTSPSGTVRSSECLIHTDGIVIYRSIDGIRTTEERNFRLETSIQARIDEAAAAAVKTSKVGPFEESFSSVAFRTSSSGIQETVVLGSFDGRNGVQIDNPSAASMVLKSLINSVCP